MPAATAKPTWVSTWFPARVSEPNVPARISPADAIAGPACASACAAATRGGAPSLISSRTRAIMRML